MDEKKDSLVMLSPLAFLLSISWLSYAIVNLDKMNNNKMAENLTVSATT